MLQAVCHFAGTTKWQTEELELAWPWDLKELRRRFSLAFLQTKLLFEIFYLPSQRMQRHFPVRCRNGRQRHCCVSERPLLQQLWWCLRSGWHRLNNFHGSDRPPVVLLRVVSCLCVYFAASVIKSVLQSGVKQLSWFHKQIFWCMILLRTTYWAGIALNQPYKCSHSFSIKPCCLWALVKAFWLQHGGGGSVIIWAAISRESLCVLLSLVR